MSLNELREKIILANKAYREGSPFISDLEFDRLVEEFQAQVTEDEYNEFRDTLHEEKGKVKHPFVMGSLNKLKLEEPDKVIKFVKEHVTGELNVSAKIDGISCRLHYSGGKLVSATTRGDGSFGQDLTDKIQYVKGVPHDISITDEIDIRGELVICTADFANMTTEFANARNACSGIMGRKDVDANDLSNISFIAYTILGPVYTKDEQFKILDDEGFVTAWHVNLSADEYLAENFVEKLSELAAQAFVCTCDGLVICDATYRNEDKYRPDDCVAFKINQQVVETTLVDVVFEGPSANGSHVPVAILEPVFIEDVTVSRCTLHNLDYIQEKGVKYGSRVKILRSGNVIPKLLSVVDNPVGSRDIELPEVCNCCGSTLVRDGVNLRCVNRECEDQCISQITYFIKQLGIKSASDKTFKKFGITSIEKLLAFRADAKKKSETKLIDELKTKLFTRSEKDIICSINMRDLAEKTITKILDHYGLDFIKTCTGSFDENKAAFLAKGMPSGVGEITLDKFLECFQDTLRLANMVTSDSRWNGSCGLQEPLVQPGTKASLGSVCFTGKLNTMSRSEASKKAIAAGYSVLDGVNKSLTYLVTNDTTSGSSKNKKAKQFGTKIITEAEFLKMINTSAIAEDINELG